MKFTIHTKNTAPMVRMPETGLSELRQQQLLPDDKFDALHHFALLVVNNRGRVTEVDIQKFLNLGYNKRHVFDVARIAYQC